MNCKFCGNDIPNESNICFVCNKVLKQKNTVSDLQDIQKDNENRYLMPYHYGKGFESYKDIKRKFICNIILAPVLVLVIWLLYLYIHPIAAIFIILVTAIMAPKELSAQYKVIKENRKKRGKK